MFDQFVECLLDERLDGVAEGVQSAKCSRQLACAAFNVEVTGIELVRSKCCHNSSKIDKAIRYCTLIDQLKGLHQVSCVFHRADETIIPLYLAIPPFWGPGNLTPWSSSVIGYRSGRMFRQRFEAMITWCHLEGNLESIAFSDELEEAAVDLCSRLGASSADPRNRYAALAMVLGWHCSPSGQPDCCCEFCGGRLPAGKAQVSFLWTLHRKFCPMRSDTEPPLGHLRKKIDSFLNSDSLRSKGVAVHVPAPVLGVRRARDDEELEGHANNLTFDCKPLHFMRLRSSGLIHDLIDSRAQDMIDVSPVTSHAIPRIPSLVSNESHQYVNAAREALQREVLPEPTLPARSAVEPQTFPQPTAVLRPPTGPSPAKLAPAKAVSKRAQGRGRGRGRG